MKKIKKLNTGGHVTKLELAEINEQYQQFYERADEATKAKMNNMILSGLNYSSADSMNNKSKRDFEYHLKSNILKAVLNENFMLNSPTAPTKNIFNGYSNAESSNLANTLVYRYLNQPTETNQQPSYSTELPVSDSGKRYYDFKFNNPENFSIGGGTFEDSYRNYVNGVIEGLNKARQAKESGKIIRGLSIEDIDSKITSLLGLLSNIGDRKAALNNLIEVLKPFNIDRDAFLTYFKNFLPKESEADINKNALINEGYKELNISDQSDYIKNLIAQNNFKFMEDEHGNKYAFDLNYKRITTPFAQINDDFSQEGVEGSSYGHGLFIDANGNVFIGDTSKITAGHRFKQALDTFVAEMKRSKLWLTKEWDFNNSYSDDELTNKLMNELQKNNTSLRKFSYTDVGALFEGNTPIIAYNPSGRRLSHSRYGDIKFDSDTRFAYIDDQGQLLSDKTLQQIEQVLGKYNRAGYTEEDNTGTGGTPLSISRMFNDDDILDMSKIIAYDPWGWGNSKTIAQDPQSFVKIVLQALVTPDNPIQLSNGKSLGITGRKALEDYGYYGSGGEKAVLATVYKLVESGKIPLTDKLYRDYVRYVKNAYASIKYQEWISSLKLGGVLKFEYGGLPTYISSALSASYHDKFDESEGIKKSKKDAQKAKEQGYSSLSLYDAATTTDVKWTTADSFRAAALAQDVAGLIAAISGAATLGAGSVAAEGLGISATVTDLVADIIDPKVSAGEVLKNLGINAALSAGAFVGTKTPKILKSATKLIPHIAMTVGAAFVAGDPEVQQTVKKLVDGKEKLNAKDWNNIYRILQMSIGLGTGAAQGVGSKRANKKLETVKVVESTLDPNFAYIENPSGGAPIALPKDKALEVKKHLDNGDNLEAKKILSELKDPNSGGRLIEDELIKLLTDTHRSWRNWFRKTDNFKIESAKEKSVIDYEALQKLITEEEKRVSRESNSAWLNLLSVGNKTPKTAVELAAMRELGINPLPFPFVENGREKLKTKIKEEIDKLPYILDPEVLDTRYDESAIAQAKKAVRHQEYSDKRLAYETAQHNNLEANARVRELKKLLDDLNIELVSSDYDSDYNWLYHQFSDKYKELNAEINKLNFSIKRQKDGPLKAVKLSELSRLEQELAEIEKRANLLLGDGAGSLKKRQEDLKSLLEERKTIKKDLNEAKTKASTAKTEYDKIRDEIRTEMNKASDDKEKIIINGSQKTNNKVKKTVTVKDMNDKDVKIEKDSKIISLIGRKDGKGEDYAKRAAGNGAREIPIKELSRIIKDVSKVNGAVVAENGTLYIYQQGGKTKYSHLRK